jgi:hypothetical protein
MKIHPQYIPTIHDNDYNFFKGIILGTSLCLCICILIIPIIVLLQQNDDSSMSQ